MDLFDEMNRQLDNMIKHSAGAMSTAHGGNGSNRKGCLNWYIYKFYIRNIIFGINFKNIMYGENYDKT